MYVNQPKCESSHLTAETYSRPETGAVEIEKTNLGRGLVSLVFALQPQEQYPTDFSDPG